MNQEVLSKINIPISDFMKTIKYHKDRMKMLDEGKCILPRLYFITETYKDLPKENKYSMSKKYDEGFTSYDPDELLQITHNRHMDFYKHILNQVLPSNHFPQRKKYYPIALSFIDLSGSRYNRPTAIKIPHVHSLFIISPKTQERFEALKDNNFKLDLESPKTRFIKTIDCEEVPWDWRDVQRVIGYSSKFYNSVHSKKYPEDIGSKIFSMHG
jgi:hypothetical protein